MIDLDDIAKLIAENLPSPYALDAVWRQTSSGAVFDLSQIDADSAKQWRDLARVVLDTLK
jgi:hypothetical protein